MLLEAWGIRELVWCWMLLGYLLGRIKSYEISCVKKVEKT